MTTTPRRLPRQIWRRLVEDLLISERFSSRRMHSSLGEYSSQRWIYRCETSLSSSHLHENLLRSHPIHHAKDTFLFLFSQRWLVRVSSQFMPSWYLSWSAQRRTSSYVLPVPWRFYRWTMWSIRRRPLSMLERRCVPLRSEWMSLFAWIPWWFVSDDFWSEMNFTGSQTDRQRVRERGREREKRTSMRFRKKDFYSFVYYMHSVTCSKYHSYGVFQTELRCLTGSTTVTIENIGIALRTFTNRWSPGSIFV